MPSIRGSSSFKPIKGITVYGATGPIGPTGATGNDRAGPTGATAQKFLTNISLTGFTLVTSFLDGSTVGAGYLKGITGNTIAQFGGLTGSTGTGFIFSKQISNTEIQIRKIKGVTAIRSRVGITSSDESITINVERFDGGFTLTSGDITDIVATDGSGNFVGATLGSAKYSQSKETTKIQKTNVFEKTRGGALNSGSMTYQRIDLVPNNVVEKYVINIHPMEHSSNDVDRSTKSKIYAIDLTNIVDALNIPRTEIIIDNPPVNPIGFSLYITGGKMVSALQSLTFKTPNGKAVKFPFGRQPCFKENQKQLIHFISSSDTWYGYIFSGSGDYFCNSVENSFTTNQQNILNFYSGLTGACCNEDGTCQTSTQDLCFGYFSGVGTTCGLTGLGPCSANIGSCCVKNIIDGKINTYCLENTSAYDCISLRSSGIDTSFNANTTCEEVDCSNSFNEVGACCDGKGGCEQVTKELCLTNGRSFLGKGVLCDSFGEQLCSSGTGACCYISGNCVETMAQTCFENSGFYHGYDSTCSGVTCTTQLNCGGFLGTTLKPGDLFGGGMVVGVYSPKTAKLLGAAHAFSRQGTTMSFLDGGETSASYYPSEYDYVGYGITGSDCTILRTNDTDSYYLIVSLYPASIDKDGNAINPTEEQAYQETFSWYGSGIAWGPLFNVNKNIVEELTYLDKSYEELYLQYGEGYYGFTGESLDNIKNITFQLCSTTRVNGTDPVARLFTRNIKTANGLWNRNWGLYNTIRMLCADNANYLKKSGKYYTYAEFDSGSDWNSLDALKLFDNSDYKNSYGFTANPSALSDWYIPSHDELAYIAANTITDSSNRYYGFDLNSNLLSNNAVPLYDWHWTSTGSFDETDDLEGIYISGKPEHGSVAWSIYFDQNGDSSNFMVKKEKRTEQLKIRPIRMMRCDGAVPTSTSDAYKLWKTPNLLRNKL